MILNSQKQKYWTAVCIYEWQTPSDGGKKIIMKTQCCRRVCYLKSQRNDRNAPGG